MDKLKEGILKINDIEFDLNISINDFINKFNKLIVNKPGFFANKKEKIQLFISNALFINYEIEYICIEFNNEKITNIDIMVDSSDDAENTYK